MEREVVIRFADLPDAWPPDAETASEQVSGTVSAGGERPRPFTGWLQLLGHLEVLSGVHRPDSRADRADHGG